MSDKIRQQLQDERVRFSNALKESLHTDAESAADSALDRLFIQLKTLRESIPDSVRRAATEINLEESISLQRRLNEMLDEAAAKAIKDHLVRRDRKLLELAQRDFLTSLPNRASFDRNLNEEVERARRYRRELSLVLLDLDQFKAINDKLGHPAGDRMLTSIADILRSSLRQSDQIFRYGGDEFVAICPETSGPAMSTLLCRLETNLGRFCLESEISRQGCHIGVSWGISSFPADALSAEELINIADQRLYDCKREHHRAITADINAA